LSVFGSPGVFVLNTLSDWSAPETGCIGKGKALPGNPYDGHIPPQIIGKSSAPPVADMWTTRQCEFPTSPPRIDNGKPFHQDPMVDPVQRFPVVAGLSCHGGSTRVKIQSRKNGPIRATSATSSPSRPSSGT
jgi:hypothetical protein